MYKMLVVFFSFIVFGFGLHAFHGSANAQYKKNNKVRSVYNIVGTWRGMAAEDGAPPYELIIQMKSPNSGISSIPSQNCRGNLSGRPTGTKLYKFSETITSGRCVNSADTIQLTDAYTMRFSQGVIVNGKEYILTTTLKKEMEESDQTSEQAMPASGSENIAKKRTSKSKSKPLTNANIKALSEAGLGDSAIVSLIEKSPCDFDKSAEALIELKTSGVSNVVIDAIVAANNGDTPADVNKDTRQQEHSGPLAATSPTEKMGRDYFISLVNSIGGGNVIEFKKNNGIKEEGSGKYTLMYTTSVTFNRIGSKVYTFSGKLIFQNSENGWIPIQQICDSEQCPGIMY